MSELPWIMVRAASCRTGCIAIGCGTTRALRNLIPWASRPSRLWTCRCWARRLTRPTSASGLRRGPFLGIGVCLSEQSATARADTPNEDSTQTMHTLPETPGAKAAVAPTRIPAHPSRRILVVEDDGAIRQSNAQVLVRSGYQVDTAEDGAAGWKALHGKEFDLMITDHDMPRLTGLELVKKVRCAPSLKCASHFFPTMANEAKGAPTLP